MDEVKKNYYGSLCSDMYEILHKQAPQDELNFYLSYAEKGEKILEPLCGSGRSVSYTHLDVYKRQRMVCPDTVFSGTGSHRRGRQSLVRRWSSYLCSRKPCSGKRGNFCCNLLG